LRSAVIALVGLFALASFAELAVADRIKTLSKTLMRSKSEKARIAAAVSLGRTQDKRAMQVLIGALQDKSNVVRAVAASALGHLGSSAALPALRTATKDKDKTVRRRATEAIGLIRRLDSKYSKPISTKRKLARYAISGRETPRLKAQKPELFVIVKAASDKSPSKTKKKTRVKRAKVMKVWMERELDRNSRVTRKEAVAEPLELEQYSIDLSIEKLAAATKGPYVEVECEIRITISNQRGKMLSFLTGGAKVQVPKRTFRTQYAPQLRKEALENAVKSVNQDLITYLRKRPS
jgi:hypothetical protein